MGVYVTQLIVGLLIGCVLGRKELGIILSKTKSGNDK